MEHGRARSLDEPAPSMRLAPPAVVFGDRVWPSDELEARARHWEARLRDALGDGGAPVAFVLTNHPDAVALFFALSTLAAPLIVLPPDPRGWRCHPALPARTPLVLLPAVAPLATEGERLGLSVQILPEATASSAPSRAGIAFLSGPGLVLFTSGSTGLPKPVFRTTPAVLAAVRADLQAFGVQMGAGVVTALPLARGFGLRRGLLAATVLGSRLGLLDRFEPDRLLRLFASGQYEHWAGTPVMAHLLSRYPEAHPPRAPRVCALGGPLSREGHARFRARFGVPLRGNYASTEHGAVTADGAPPADVRPETVGRAVPGVELRVGDDPRDPFPAGDPGRIWIRTPWPMEGYGFPPRLEPRAERHGWCWTNDLGRLDESGYLTLAGRADDCVATGAGHLVNLADVAAILAGYPGVRDAAVVPLEGPDGLVIGALVEGDDALDPSALRDHVGRVLAPASQPRLLEVWRELPRLADGKIDRRGCIAALGGSPG